MDPIRNDVLGTTDYRIRNTFTGRRTLFSHFWEKYQNSPTPVFLSRTAQFKILSAGVWKANPSEPIRNEDGQIIAWGEGQCNENRGELPKYIGRTTELAKYKEYMDAARAREAKRGVATLYDFDEEGKLVETAGVRPKPNQKYIDQQRQRRSQHPQGQGNKRQRVTESRSAPRRTEPQRNETVEDHKEEVSHEDEDDDDENLPDIASPKAIYQNDDQDHITVTPKPKPTKTPDLAKQPVRTIDLSDSGHVVKRFEKETEKRL